jgi:hypothetical protein
MLGTWIVLSSAALGVTVMIILLRTVDAGDGR